MMDVELSPILPKLVPRLERCGFFFSLRLGTLILALSGIFMGCDGIFQLINFDPNQNEKDIPFILIVILFTLPASLLLFLGIIFKITALMVPYMVLQVQSIYCFLLFLLAAFISPEFKDKPEFAFSTLALIIIFYYGFLVVHSHYQELKERRKELYMWVNDDVEKILEKEKV